MLSEFDVDFPSSTANCILLIFDHPKNEAFKIAFSNPLIGTFTKLRSFKAFEFSLKEEVGSLKTSTNQLFKIVFERLDNLDEEITPKLPANRKK